MDPLVVVRVRHGPLADPVPQLGGTVGHIDQVHPADEVALGVQDDVEVADPGVLFGQQRRVPGGEPAGLK